MPGVDFFSDHEHECRWGPIEHSNLAGTTHRKCLEDGCRYINAYDDDGDELQEEGMTSTYLVVWSGGYESTLLAVAPTFEKARKMHDNWIADAAENDTIDIYVIDIDPSNPTIYAVHPETGEVL